MISGMVFGKFKKLNLLYLTFTMIQFLTSGRNRPVVKLVKWTLNSTKDFFSKQKSYIYSMKDLQNNISLFNCFINQNIKVQCFILTV